MITNYGELKASIQKWLHRDDLEEEIPTFVSLAAERIGRRLGAMPPPLVADFDTNNMLTYHSGIYLYGSLREGAIHTHDSSAEQIYDRLFQNELADMNINYHGSDWDTCPPPVMAPYEEPEEAL